MQNRFFRGTLQAVLEAATDDEIGTICFSEAQRVRIPPCFAFRTMGATTTLLVAVERRQRWETEESDHPCPNKTVEGGEVEFFTRQERYSRENL